MAGAGLALATLAVSGCSQTMDMASSVKAMVLPSGSHGYGDREKQCLMRAMFFESNRSSRDGLIAVGTVVMNRLRSGKHGDTICAVVGERGQFAPGVMTRPMNSRSLPDVEAAADAVLRGERHAKVKNAMYFHTAGLKFPYRNMHYTLVAGGNAFYEKRNRRGDPVELPPERKPGWFGTTTMVASAEPATTVKQDRLPVARSVAARPEAIGPEAREPILVASAEDMPPTFDAPLALSGKTPSSRRASAISTATAEPAAPTTARPLPSDAPVPSAPPGANLAARMGDAPPPFAMASTPGSAPTMSFDVDQSDADAIGAMIANGY